MRTSRLLSNCGRLSQEYRELMATWDQRPIANDKPRRPFRLSVKALLIVAVIVIVAVGGDQRLFAATNGLTWMPS